MTGAAIYTAGVRPALGDINGRHLKKEEEENKKKKERKREKNRMTKREK